MQEYKKKAPEELTKILEEKREEVRSARFEKSGSAKKNTKSVSLAKKEIARILTEQNTRKSVAKATV